MQAWHATRSSATGKRRGPTKTVLGTGRWLGDAGNLRRLADTGHGGREAGSGWTWFVDAADHDALTPTSPGRRDFEVGVRGMFCDPFPDTWLCLDHPGTWLGETSASALLPCLLRWRGQNVGGEEDTRFGLGRGCVMREGYVHRCG